MINREVKTIKESCTTSCFPEKEEWTGSGISQAF